MHARAPQLSPCYGLAFKAGLAHTGTTGRLGTGLGSGCHRLAWHSAASASCPRPRSRWSTCLHTTADAAAACAHAHGTCIPWATCAAADCVHALVLSAGDTAMRLSAALEAVAAACWQGLRHTHFGCIHMHVHTHPQLRPATAAAVATTRCSIQDTPPRDQGLHRTLQRASLPALAMDLLKGWPACTAPVHWVHLTTRHARRTAERRVAWVQAQSSCSSRWPCMQDT